MMMREGITKKKRTREGILEDFIAATNTQIAQRLQWTNWRSRFCFGGWIANMMAVRIPN
jgi:carboxymethylenebutenolidase